MPHERERFKHMEGGEVLTTDEQLLHLMPDVAERSGSKKTEFNQNLKL